MMSVFLGLVGIVAILSAVASKEFQRTKQYNSVLMFTVCILCYCTLYFAFYFREKVLAIYELELPWRIADYTAGCLIVFFWVFLTLNFNESANRDKTLLVITTSVVAVRALFSYVMTSIYMDAYYRVTDGSIVRILFGLETFLVILCLVLIVFSSYQAFKNSSLSVTRTYILLVSAALSALEIAQIIYNYHLYLGRFGVSEWEMYVFDPVPPVFIFVNLVNVIFIFKADFAPIYIASIYRESSENLGSSVKIDAEALLDVTAEKHRLTLREREIMRLIYEGFTNPDIAAELFISRNTVKRHLHNIFEKLDVSNRIEVIHLINSQRQHDTSLK
jgi:DNA-binding CsgD family transcriptional regulator